MELHITSTEPTTLFPATHNSTFVSAKDRMIVDALSAKWDAKQWLKAANYKAQSRGEELTLLVIDGVELPLSGRAYLKNINDALNISK